MIVAKFGGTSMAQPEVVASIIKNNPEQKIIVCSAPGKSENYPHKVTDLLIAIAKEGNSEDEKEAAMMAVLEKFAKAVAGLDADFQKSFLRELEHDLRNYKSNEFLVSRGEYYSAKALSHRIDAEFIDASDLFVFSSLGKIDRETSDRRIKSIIKSDTRYVVPGFYGCDLMGNIRLFGRGGSDRTGAILASSLGAVYENWTDVSGIMSADPKKFEQAKILLEITYEETREGAHGGTNVLMGDSILDLEYEGVETWLKNTFEPNAHGTKIIKTRNHENDKSEVVAISARDDLMALSIRDLGMRDAKGYLAKLTEVLAGANISIEHLPAAQDSITITFQAEVGRDYLSMTEKVKANTISPNAQVSTKSCGVVYLVGEKLREAASQQKVLIKALSKLEKESIASFSTSAHVGSPSIAIILCSEDALKAEKILFEEFLT